MNDTLQLLRDALDAKVESMREYERSSRASSYEVDREASKLYAVKAEIYEELVEVIDEIE